MTGRAGWGRLAGCILATAGVAGGAGMMGGSAAYAANPPAPATPAVPAVPVLTADGKAPVGEANPDVAMARSATVPPGTVGVQDLDLTNMTSGWQVPRVDRSVDNRPLTLSGVVYPHGIGVLTHSTVTIQLQGTAVRFVSVVGVDDEVHQSGEVRFALLADGRLAADTGVMKGGDPPRLLSVDLRGVRTLVMTAEGVEHPAQYDSLGSSHGDWAGAQIQLLPGVTALPATVDFSRVPDAFQFPRVVPDGEKPAIHGPRVLGVRPGSPVVYGVSATGKGPLHYTAAALPAGLALDADTGVLTGQVAAAGAYPVELQVTGPAGSTSRKLTIVCDPQAVSLTPPMGWDAWNIFGDTVTTEKVQAQAALLEKSGLAAHGYRYLVVGDSWQARRNQDGTLAPNTRFGSMQQLASTLHRRGLKLGIYSSATEQTCAGYAGSGGHEAADAAAYAAWGVDYLHYDWCDPSASAKTTDAPAITSSFAAMQKALTAEKRDILLEANPLGFVQPGGWMADLPNAAFGTSPQILDQWGSIERDGFGQATRMPLFARGQWNDPGWLMVGRMGATAPRFTHLRQAEIMTQVSLWSLMGAPLMVSCDLAQLDPNPECPITTAALTNDEVIDIDQDALGQPGSAVVSLGDIAVWVRPLADGTKAVGLFNRKRWTQEITVPWSVLGFTAPQPVRDLWQHRDLGAVSGSYSAMVPGHGVVLLKIGTPNPDAA